jgi:transposase
MRFVEIRQEAQIDLQALHRIRDRISANRIQLICQMRAFCLEYGIAMRPGAGVFKLDMARILADETNDLTPMMRTMLRELWDEFVVVDARLATVSRQVEAIADRVDAARRLMSIPGIGPLGATALLAAIGDGRQFRKARDLAAWLGLVPRQNSTGGRTTLLGISKRGNPYLRRLIIHGARSCIAHLNRERDRMGEWIGRLEQRMHRNKVVVAFANKIARMAWAVLTRPGNLYERVDPAQA